MTTGLSYRRMQQAPPKVSLKFNLESQSIRTWLVSLSRCLCYWMHPGNPQRHGRNRTMPRFLRMPRQRRQGCRSPGFPWANKGSSTAPDVAFGETPSILLYSHSHTSPFTVVPEPFSLSTSAWELDTIWSVVNSLIKQGCMSVGASVGLDTLFRYGKNSYFLPWNWLNR